MLTWEGGLKEHLIRQHHGIVVASNDLGEDVADVLLGVGSDGGTQYVLRILLLEGWIEDVVMLMLLLALLVSFLMLSLLLLAVGLFSLLCLSRLLNLLSMLLFRLVVLQLTRGLFLCRRTFVLIQLLIKERLQLNTAYVNMSKCQITVQEVEANPGNS